MTTHKGTIAEAYQDYARQVLHPDSPDVQRVETRRAFFAGAWAMLQACTRVAPDDVDEDSGVRMLEELEEECLAFYRDVKAGRA